MAIATLALSAVAFVGILTREDYTDRAIIPTQGDRPTKGFGSTVGEDGKPVKMGDRTTPVAAARLAISHIEGDEAQIKQCVRVPLHQAEYDAYVDLAYNIGAFNFCTGGRAGGTSGIVRRLNAGDYVGACNAILDWKFAAGFDCSTPGNKRCAGVWTDRQRVHKQCMEAQQ